MSIFVTKVETGKISINVAGSNHTTTIDLTGEQALELASEIVRLASGGIGNSYKDVISGLKNGDQGFDDTDKLKAEVARYKGLYQEIVKENERVKVGQVFRVPSFDHVDMLLDTCDHLMAGSYRSGKMVDK